MKPVDFNFERPASLTDALELMSRDDMNVVALAGGQSLLPMMNFRMVRPDILVDLNGLDELRGSEIGPDRARIGAMTRYSDLASNAELMARLPLLASALPHVANSAIRNRGTLGGSIAMADPTTEMPAVMLALGATIRLASRDGERSVA
ncbi:MAG: FAD binding domain-containing protein, partial [Albidovulum sp.]|nr:FAD binding domain-containing protein [Albidovulum sp.]